MTTLDAIVPATHPRVTPFPPPPGPVQFLGYERAYWRLLIRGAVLLAVTLGIYRFWLTTDMRRFLWSNTEVLGETLEYTGTARELLIGFLIACAILVPIYALLFLIALNLGTIGQLASVIGFAALTVLGQYAVYRARRYRLTRTIYRGVRFLQTGSAWRYAIYATFWSAIVLISLGLLYPLMQSRLERFKMRNTYLGNLPGRFEGTAGGLFLRGILLWIIVIGPLIAALIGVIATFDVKAIEDLARGGGEAAIRRMTTNNPAFTAALGLGFGAMSWSAVHRLVVRVQHDGQHRGGDLLSADQATHRQTWLEFGRGRNRRCRHRFRRLSRWRARLFDHLSGEGQAWPVAGDRRIGRPQEHRGARTCLLGRRAELAGRRGPGRCVERRRLLSGR